MNKKAFFIAVVLVISLTVSTFSLSACSAKTPELPSSQDFMCVLYEAELIDDTQDFDSAMQETITEITSMLVSKGYTEAVVQREGVNKIRITVPDVDDPTAILNLIGSPAQIKFVLNGSTVFTGREIVKATAMYSAESEGYVVALSLNAEGAKVFGDATANNIGSSMDIITIIAGEERTISSPQIQAGITDGKAVITGMQSLAAAQELAERITAGRLALSLRVIEMAKV